MKNHIHPLFVGYSYTDKNDANYTRANCSCTLIRMANNKNIIIDTMTSWDKKRIIDSLAERGIQPADISAVICTHGHSDHIGCNGLFDSAECHIVGTSISKGDRYLNYDWGSSSNDYFEKAFKPFGDDLLIFRTPGHTMQCVSVILKNSQLSGIVGIAGDLFENVQDIAEQSIWREAGSENPEAQKTSRFKFAEMCDYIIPGHGPGFTVSEGIRIHLKEQM